MICNGVHSFVLSINDEAILPISVFIPVPVIIALPRPYETYVDENIQLCISPSDTSSFSIVSILFVTGTDSPVNADSSITKETDSMILPSAGIKSPASILITSPGTNSCELIEIRFPSLNTFALGVLNFFNASNDFSALLS